MKHSFIVAASIFVLSTSVFAQNNEPEFENFPAELMEGPEILEPASQETAIANKETASYSGSHNAIGALPWAGSMMLNQETRDILYDMVSNGNFTEIPIASLGLFDEETAATTVVSEQIAQNINEIQIFMPAFNLQSIVYFSDDNWSIWLNGKRNRVDNSRQDRLEIHEVTPQYTVMTYTEPNLNDLLPNWQENMLSYDKRNAPDISERYDSKPYIWDYISENGLILIDSEQGAMRFKLRPSQTFVSHQLALLEGKHAGETLSFVPGQGRVFANEDGQINGQEIIDIPPEISAEQEALNKIFDIE